MSALAPVTPGERLDQLDILRGFALFGILLVNFEYFLNPIQSVVLGHTGGLQTPADAVDLGIKILAEGKFYPLFAMLFGAGFALMYERAVERGQGFWSVYLRRLLILLVFGLVHLLLIWSGDILLVYALVAFVMVLLFRRTPASRLPKWAVVFLLVPTLAIVALAGLVAMVPPSAAGELQQEFAAELVSTRETVAQAAAIYANGSFVEASSQRLEDLPFLLWQENMIIPTPSLALASVCLAVGAPLLAFGYLAVIVVNRHRLTWLAPAGRMALTNYLMQ
ncbi:MAG: DUF418 domain-containing protein, partial [Gammaproteobacteria bacterium]|nr:DUF418 domain-containing protein [Gammaproteobacteria bacterium]